MEEEEEEQAFATRVSDGILSRSIQGEGEEEETRFERDALGALGSDMP